MTDKMLHHPGKFVRANVIPDGVTVTKAAEMLGVGRVALSNFLNGKAALSEKMADRLRKTFDVDREALLEMQRRFDARAAVDPPRGLADRFPRLRQFSTSGLGWQSRGRRRLGVGARRKLWLGVRLR